MRATMRGGIDTARLTGLERDAMAYQRARMFLDELRRERWLTSQQVKTLRGQAVKGDLDAAIKGLATLKARRSM
jgi:hypothetical protein